ncbi:endonuclease/exonuclease/phosphatase family protein [Arthrobacter sp. E3]|uniref:endonuclease/exonuclease/phosphatase family protein n=1 Tax=Arthrobacter sp. E3 TaxID=517402 RepID=UPI001FFC97CB|nr:endonuclease/exonuclease/phosphatase family protein [Arthrobacter sp. E3]
MSWNIRRRVRHLIPRPVDRWDQRAPAVEALLRAEKPTLLGVQEALADQAEFVARALGGDYRWVGRGRGPGGGESCPLFYDAERLEMLDWQQAALSDHPTSPGSTSWGNVIPRIMVSATFVDRATARHFMAVNTHFDHLSARSRLRSAQAVGRLVSTGNLPAVVTGDLNAGVKSAPLRVLLEDGRLAETWDVSRAHESEEWGTFPNYKRPLRNGKRLDWILASPAFRVDRAAINAQLHAGRWASDHLPVQAVMVLREAGGSE